MDPSESLRRGLRGYAGNTNQNVHPNVYNSPLIASDAYNFLAGQGALEHPPKEPGRLHPPPISEGESRHSTGSLIGTLYTNHFTPSSGILGSPSGHPVPSSSNWDHSIHGGGLYHNILISGGGMSLAPSASTTTAQLLIGGLHGGSSFHDDGQSDHNNVYYPASGNQHEPMQMYFVNTSAGYSHHFDHLEGRSSVGTLLYNPQDGETSAQRSSSSHSHQQYGHTVSFPPPNVLAQRSVSNRNLDVAGAMPLSVQDGHSGTRNQSYDWRHGGNEHSFLPRNEETHHHQSLFGTDISRFGGSRENHDLSHMHRTDHLGLHMDQSQGFSGNGQGLSLSLSSHHSQFQPTGGQLPDADIHMNAVAHAAAMAKTKDFASSFLTGPNADLSRFRVPSRDDLGGGVSRFHQQAEQVNIQGPARKHTPQPIHQGVSSSATGGLSQQFSRSRFLMSAQAILNEVCRISSLKRAPKPPRPPTQQYWNNTPGAGSSASVNGNFVYYGNEDRSAMHTEVNLGKDRVSFPSGVENVSHDPFQPETIPSLCNTGKIESRDELEVKKGKLILMLDEVEVRYRRYSDHLLLVNTGFNSQAGPFAANPYTILAHKVMSRHFRCLKDAILNQLKVVKRALGEEDKASGETTRLRYVDQQMRQQRALQQFGMYQQHAWRPQRGLPERAVSLLRAWLFEHFLHPYPKDGDKMSLAKQTGLTRSQVSNWFINARVRLWKPMVEEMYVEEQKEAAELALQVARMAREAQVNIRNNPYEQHEGSAGQSSVIQEGNANGLKSRTSNDSKKGKGKEHDEGPSAMETDSSTEVHSQLILTSGQVVVGVEESTFSEEEGREAKKPRNSASNALVSINTPVVHPRMNLEGVNSEKLKQEGEDLEKGDTGIPVLPTVINRDEKLKGIATTDHELEPKVGKLAGYAPRASTGSSASTGVSLTLALRHPDANLLSPLAPPVLPLGPLILPLVPIVLPLALRHTDASLTPPLAPPVLPKFEADLDVGLNQVNKPDTNEGRIDEVGDTGLSYTAPTDEHNLQAAEDFAIDVPQELSPGGTSMAIIPKDEDLNGSN